MIMKYVIPAFDCRKPSEEYVLDEGPGRYYRVLDGVLWSEAYEGGKAVASIKFPTIFDSENISVL